MMRAIRLLMMAMTVMAMIAVGFFVDGRNHSPLAAQQPPPNRGQNRGFDAGTPFFAVVGRGGELSVSRDGRRVFAVSVGLFDRNWQMRTAQSTAPRDLALDAPREFSLQTPTDVPIAGTARFAMMADQRALRAEWEFRPERAVELNSLHASADVGVTELIGGTWEADDRRGTFPENFGELVLFFGSVSRLRITLPTGGWLNFAFPDPTPVLIQDNRQWGPIFSLRIHRSTPPGQAFAAGQAVRVGYTLTANTGIEAEVDRETAIVAGDEWVPVPVTLDITAGSALDFSTMGLHDAPAGKHGFLVVRPDGHFAFEKNRDVPRRFYGVNLCYGAQYLSNEQADRLAQRLFRLGYNAVRIHHFEGLLGENGADSLAFNAQRLAQLDYLLAALISRGIYVKVDLFTSRPVRAAEIGVERVDMNAFKVLVPVHERAWQNWCAFARQFLHHTNPHTNRRYADEPGMPWVSLINEGNLKNYFHLIRDIPEWRAEWNRWLRDHYRTREALETAWNGQLGASEDFGISSVRWPDALTGNSLRVRDAIRCISAVERHFAERATTFLRDELGAKALLTNLNGWTNHVTDQHARSALDFVDDHFYVDHPQFLQQQWRLPSRCDNQNPIAQGAPGGRAVAFTRLFGRPFTVSEYNFSAPGRYRGVGGILTGALGALQDWDGIWRFAYAHNAESLFRASPMNYFDMASDPLAQAADRASICLFLRRDLQPAKHTLSIAMTPADLAAPPAPVPTLAPSWHWAAWVCQVGTKVVHAPATDRLTDDMVVPVGFATAAAEYRRSGAIAAALSPYGATDAAIVGAMQQRRMLARNNPTNPTRGVFHPDGGQITIEAPESRFTIDTPRTAGGFAPSGGTIKTADGSVEISIAGSEATVWVSALDSEPITRSSRLLITHLTDVQNSGIRYAERTRQTLLEWGTLPHLARAGTATLRIRMRGSRAMKLYALSTSGDRVKELPVTVRGTIFEFALDVKCAPDHGAILTYELVR